MNKTILVPVDLRHESSWNKALPAAIDHARHIGGQLHVMTVVPEVDFSLPTVHLPKDFNRRQLEEAKKMLADLVKAQIPDDIPVQTSVRDGNIYREILDEANDSGVELIVMASHRPSLKDYLLGANAARVVRHAVCSVWIVR